MKKLINFIISVSICGMISSCQSSLDVEKERIKEQVKSIDVAYAQFQQSPSYNTVMSVIQATQKPDIEVSKEEIKSQREKLHYENLVKFTNEKRNHIFSAIDKKINEIAIPILSLKDNLMNVGSSTIAMRLKKGDHLKFNFDGESAVNVTIYNIDSKQSVKHL